MTTLENLIFLIALLIVIVIIYYKFTKIVLIKLASIIAHRSHFWKNYTLQEKMGAYELTLIAISHIIFCAIVIYVLSIKFDQLGLLNFNPILLGYGIVLGVAELSLSTMLCMVMIRVLQISIPKQVPHGVNAWSTLSRGGWIRHHLHTIKLLPLTIALSIIFLQLFSEELFFRGIIINLLTPYGYVLASIVSIMLFVGMQIFHMPSKISAMFPVIGSIVMGIVHTLLYIAIPDLLPLVVAHFVFFISAVL